MVFARLLRWIGVELIALSPAEKVVSALGGTLSILLLILWSHWILPETAAWCVVASMGASAVLLFALPHGTLSQPWPVVAGHALSALCGVACARWIGPPTLAAALAVGLSIAVMHQLKCIHPPGGATALTAVMGGSAIHDLGFSYIFLPITLNALSMVLLAVILNAPFRWRRYPAAWHPPVRTAPPPSGPAIPAPTHEEILSAVRSLDTFVDISEDDLLRLIELIHAHPRHPPEPSPQI